MEDANRVNKNSFSGIQSTPSGPQFRERTNDLPRIVVVKLGTPIGIVGILAEML